MTTKELIKTYNALATERGLTPLTGWKASKEVLQAKIDGLAVDPLDLPDDAPEATEVASAAEPDTVSPSVAETTTGQITKPEELNGLIPSGCVGPGEEVHDVTKFLSEIRLKAAGPGIGHRVRAWLLEPEVLGYPEIVRRVTAEFPDAKTSTRSVVSVAAQMRREGIELPKRKTTKA